MAKMKTKAASTPKPEPAAPPRSGPGRSISTNVRSTPEWKAWLLRFSAHVRKDMADTIDEAMVRYARAEGFDLPPKR